MSNKEGKQKRFDVPIYHGVVTIHQVKDLANFGERFNPEMDLNNYGAFFTHRANPKGYFEYRLAFNYEVYDGLIAHECLHFVNRLFYNTGMQLDPINDESQCYIMGWIVDKCYGFLEIKD